MPLIHLHCGADKGVVSKPRFVMGVVMAESYSELLHAATEAYGGILELGMQLVLTYRYRNNSVAIRSESHFKTFLKICAQNPKENLRILLEQRRPHQIEIRKEHIKHDVKDINTSSEIQIEFQTESFTPIRQMNLYAESPKSAQTSPKTPESTQSDHTSVMMSPKRPTPLFLSAPIIPKHLEAVVPDTPETLLKVNQRLAEMQNDKSGVRDMNTSCKSFERATAPIRQMNLYPESSKSAQMSPKMPESTQSDQKMRDLNDSVDSSQMRDTSPVQQRTHYPISPNDAYLLPKTREPESWSAPKHLEPVVRDEILLRVRQRLAEMQLGGSIVPPKQNESITWAKTVSVPHSIPKPSTQLFTLANIRRNAKICVDGVTRDVSLTNFHEMTESILGDDRGGIVLSYVVESRGEFKLTTDTDVEDLYEAYRRQKRVEILTRHIYHMSASNFFLRLQNPLNGRLVERSLDIHCSMGLTFRELCQLAARTGLMSDRIAFSYDAGPLCVDVEDEEDMAAFNAVLRRQRCGVFVVAARPLRV